jgi:hypothetical protein
MDSAFLEDIPKRELVNLCVKLNITKSKYKSKPRTKIAELIIKRLLDNNSLTQQGFVENYAVVLPYPNEMYFTSSPNPSELYIPPRPMTLSIPFVYPRTMSLHAPTAYPTSLAYPTSTEQQSLLTFATPITPDTPDTPLSPDTPDTPDRPITRDRHNIQMTRDIHYRPITQMTQRPRPITPCTNDDNTSLPSSNNVNPKYKYKNSGIVGCCYDILSIFFNPTILCIFLDPMLYCINNITGFIQWWIEVWYLFLNPNTYITQVYDLMSYIQISFYRNVGMFVLFTCLFVALYICLFWSICFNLIVLIYYFGIR